MAVRRRVALPQAEAAAPEACDQKQRDFGPALASQLGRDIPSVLSVRLGGEHTISYNLHSMDQASVWRGGFLDLKQTQHFRERGEGVGSDRALQPLHGPM